MYGAFFFRFLQVYVVATHPEAVRWMGYSQGLGIILLLINKYATFVWNFLDIFIASVALILSRHCRGYSDALAKTTNGISISTNDVKQLTMLIKRLTIL